MRGRAAVLGAAAAAASACDTKRSPYTAEGIVAGVPTADTGVIGTCAGTSGDAFVCAGEDNYVQWAQPLGTGDFTATVSLLIEKVEHTAAALVFWSHTSDAGPGGDLPGLDYVGLDGDGQRIFYEGAHWGATQLLPAAAPAAGQFVSVVMERAGGALSVSIDNRTVVKGVPMGFAPYAVGVRPWRAAVRVRDLGVCAPAPLPEPPAPTPAPPPPPPPLVFSNDTTVVFDSKIPVPGSRGKINCYRIPMIAQTPRALVAFTEAREGSCSDCVVNGIAMSRSTDGGRTWGGPTWAVSDQSTDPSRPTMDIGGNPSAVYDSVAKKLILQFVRGDANVSGKPFGQKCNPASTNWQIESADDGATWSEPYEITKFLGSYHGSLVGPANGIQLKGSEHSGRLVWCGHWGVYNSTQVWYSDDHGKTYTLSATVFEYMDECTVAELQDGRVYLNMRNNHKTSCDCRAFAVSGDGGATFGALQYDPVLVSPVCQATLSSAGGTLLFANPATTRGRNTGKIRKSTDMGKTWSSELAVTPSSGADSSFDYSCLLPDPLNDDPKKGGLLWSHNKGGWLALFSRFDLDF